MHFFVGYSDWGTEVGFIVTGDMLCIKNNSKFPLFKQSFSLRFDIKSHVPSMRISVSCHLSVCFLVALIAGFGSMHYSVGVTQARLDLVQCLITRLHLLNGSSASTSQEGIQREKQQPNNIRDPKRPFTRP